MLALYYGNAIAQELRPILEEGKKWTVAGVHATWEGSPFRGYGTYNIYTLRGETSVDGQTWKQLYCYDMNEQGVRGVESRVALLREENGLVYFYDTEGKTEKLLLDIAAAEGDELSVEERAVSRWNDTPARRLMDVSVTRVSTYSYGSNTLKRLDLKWSGEGIDESHPYEFSWVEGIGAIGQEPFNNDPIGVTSTFVPRLADCQVNGEVLYRDEAIYAYMHETLPGEFPEAESSRPILEEGKTWVVDNDIASGNIFHILAAFSISEGPIASDVQFWSVSQLQYMNGGVIKETEVVRDYYVGEKDGRLYFWDGSEQHEPDLFMDFSLTVGSSISLETIKFDEKNVRIEVTAESDTVLASSTDRRSRRCLHVSYLMEDTPGNWAEVERDVWVEGVGSLKYGIMFPYYFGTTGGALRLLMCQVFDDILYKYGPKSISLNEDEKRMVASSNDFAFNLLRAMREQEDTDIVISPLSITIALGMLNNSASGLTQKEISQTMGFDNADAVNSFCRRILTESNKLDWETKSLIANAIFINEGQGYSLQQPFVDIARSYYDATPEARDFNDGQTMAIINQWASDHTMGMVREVLNRSSFNPFAVSYLLNATYFKGAWTKKFRKEFTSERDFGKTGKKVPMMVQEDDFLYAEDEYCQYISLPYGNGAYSMTVFLPREDKTLEDVLSGLSGQNWEEWKEKGKVERVNLELPRFETSVDVRLNDIMQTLGIREAFLETAEFPYFCNHHVFIAYMKQAAKITVDEEGTQAAAVTVIGMETTGIPKTYFFHANRPFLYTISEQSTGTIFFIGQYLGKGEGISDGVSSPSLVTRHSPLYYDLQGRRLMRQPARGVYIKDGKMLMR